MEETSSHKKLYLIIGLVVTLFIIVFLALIFKIDQEEKLTKALKEMGSEFYENFYYLNTTRSIDSSEEALKKYVDTGIKINLENLSKYNNLENEAKLTQFTKQECDKNTTMVIIYPKEPFNKIDYEIEVILDCEFKK